MFRAFRCLDRAETAVMGVVYVSDLETGALTRQTAGAEGGQTALVGDFGQRVGLVHELRQRVGTEEGVDNRRDGLGVDEVDGVNTSLSRTFMRSRMVRDIRVRPTPN